MSEATTPARQGKDVAGKATYLELIKSGYTVQIILVPTVLSESGTGHIPGNFMYRRMNSIQARKNWHFHTQYLRASSGVTDFNKPVDGKFVVRTAEEAKNFTVEALRMVRGYFTSLRHQEYQMRKDPIVVEITYDEVMEIHNGKTPTGLIRRIHRSRIAKGYGEDIVTAVVAPLAPAAV